MTTQWIRAEDPIAGEVWSTLHGQSVCAVATTEDAVALLYALSRAGRRWETVVGRDSLAASGMDPAVLYLDVSAMNSMVSMSGPGGYVQVQIACTWGHLEQNLKQEGYTLGPLPAALIDTPLIKSLGETGCVRPSPRYGSLRDSFLAVQAALPTGVTQCALAPRRAMGPDLARATMGPGGDAGVLTQVHLQIWGRPLHRARFEVQFSSRAAGVAAMWRMADAGVRPAVWCLRGGESQYVLELELEERYPVTGLIERLQGCVGQMGVCKERVDDDRRVLDRLEGPLYWHHSDPGDGDIWDVSGFGVLVDRQPPDGQVDWSDLTAQFITHARRVALESTP